MGKRMGSSSIVWILLFISQTIMSPVLFSQSITNSEIIIIGVFHNANEYRNTRSLLPLLKQLKPDVILSETDTLSGYFKRDYQLKNPPLWYKIFLKIGLARKMPPEHEVLYLLKKENKKLIFYPFDIAIKRRKEHVKDAANFEKKFMDDLNRTNDAGGIPKVFEEHHKTLLLYNNYYYSLNYSGYQNMNRPVVTDSIRELMHQEYKYLPMLMDSVETLKKYKEKYWERKTYWETRNEKMAENILFFIQRHKGKRIIILTGLLHKYLLTDLLKPQEKNYGFKLKEWME